MRAAVGYTRAVASAETSGTSRLETLRLRRNTERINRIALLAAGRALTANASAAVSIAFNPSKANAVSFKPGEARFVRVLIHETSAGEPCIDELEVYGRGEKEDLALASTGAKTAASSCLTGFPIHQIHHLNNGRHGNPHSWIAAGSGGGMGAGGTGRAGRGLQGRPLARSYRRLLRFCHIPRRADVGRAADLRLQCGVGRHETKTPFGDRAS
jgi:hypothetical protein